MSKIPMHSVGIPRSGCTILFNLLRSINKEYGLHYDISFPAHQAGNPVFRVGIIRNPFHVISSNIKLWKDSSFNIHRKLYQRRYWQYNSDIALNLLDHVDDFLGNMYFFKYTIVYDAYLPHNMEALIDVMTKKIFGQKPIQEKTLKIYDEYNIKSHEKKYSQKKFDSKKIDKETLFKPGHISTKGEGSFKYLTPETIAKINRVAAYKLYSWTYYRLLNGQHFNPEQKDFIYSKEELLKVDI